MEPTDAMRERLPICGFGPKPAPKRSKQAVMTFLKRKTQKPVDAVEPGYAENTGLHYLEVLARLFGSRRPDWYLEIGSRDGKSLSYCPCNYIAIDVEFAVRYDIFNAARQMFLFQQSSDDFFDAGFLTRNGIVPDMAFVDGMHHFEFALRDMINCERNMKADGLICLHDVSPYNAAMTTRDSDHSTVLKRAWTGDVWKVVAALLDHRPDLEIDVLNARSTGLACITNLDPKNSVLVDNYDRIVEKYKDLELSQVGPQAYFDRFTLTDAEQFLARR